MNQGTSSSLNSTIMEFSSAKNEYPNKEIIRITKVKEPYGWMHNMSPHPIKFQGITFRTAEALFQWMRFEGHPKVQNEILEQKSPMAAKMKARKHQALLNRGEKWDESPEDIQRMKTVLSLKFSQHSDLAIKLKRIDTQTTGIIEDCTTHDRESSRFWGAVLDKKTKKWIGKNVLGNLLMQLSRDLCCKPTRNKKQIKNINQ